jgi:type I restriction enzyme S subunit
MIAGLKPYAEYKGSDLPWLEQVPAHWGLVPNRGLVRRRKVLVGERHTDFQLLSLTKQGVIVRDISTGKGKFSSDMGTSQEVRDGDLVFCLFDVPETPRTVGLSRHAGMITGAYTVFESLGNGSSEYFELFYRAMDDRKLLSPLYSGLRNTIPAARFLGTKTPLPPMPEQQAIVRFLNWANGRLDCAIRSKRKVIALLNEQKQAIIHRAVTRGLDPNAALKPSGVPWLGDIPAHWEVKRLKNWVSINSQTLGEHTPPDFEFDYLDIGSVTTGKLAKPPVRICFGTSPSRARRVLKHGDTIVSTVRTYLKAVVTVSDFDRPLVASTGFAVLTPRPDTSARCLGYVAQAEVFTNQVTVESVGIAYPAISEGRLGNIFVTLPPPAEQTEIVRFLDAELEGFNTTITRLEREIILLLEYRTRLVADVVTGKFDVREAAATLPVDVPLDATSGEDISDDTDNPDEEASE